MLQSIFHKVAAVKFNLFYASNKNFSKIVFCIIFIIFKIFDIFLVLTILPLAFTKLCQLQFAKRL